MRRLGVGLGAALTVWASGADAQVYDPMFGTPPPSPAPRPAQATPAPALAVGSGRGAKASPTRSYGPFGWQGPEAPDIPNPPTTKLLTTVGGTPLYEAAPATASPTAAVTSRLLPIRLDTGLPLGAGIGSPHLDGGGIRFLHHYLIDFWRNWPEAKVRGEPGSSQTKPGYAPPSLAQLQITNKEGVPASAVPALRRQADALYQAVLKLPMIHNSQGVMIKPQMEVFPSRSPMGAQVYGWMLYVKFISLDGQLTEVAGRWRTEAWGDYPALELCSNCRIPERPPVGVYRGTQVLIARRQYVNDKEELNALVVTNGRPLVTPTRDGASEVPNPDFYDPARPKTDIQILLVQPAAGTPVERDAAFMGQVSPASPYGRIVAATFLPDWKTLVDQVNSPGAPRAQ